MRCQFAPLSSDRYTCRPLVSVSIRVRAGSCTRSYNCAIVRLPSLIILVSDLASTSTSRSLSRMKVSTSSGSWRRNSSLLMCAIRRALSGRSPRSCSVVGNTSQLSTVAYSVCGCDAAIAKPMRPTFAPDGKPLPLRCQVPPPSVDFQMPLPAPFAWNFHGLRVCSHSDAYSTFGSLASCTRSIAPEFGRSAFSTRDQFLPPSVLRYTPGSPPSVYRRPATATKMRLLSFGSTTMRAIRSLPASPARWKCLPPSSLRNRPMPPYDERDAFGSPVPTHSVSGCCGSNAMAPITVVGSASVSGSKLTPSSTVFHTPPVA